MKIVASITMAWQEKYVKALDMIWTDVVSEVRLSEQAEERDMDTDKVFLPSQCRTLSGVMTRISASAAILQTRSGRKS